MIILVWLRRIFILLLFLVIAGIILIWVTGNSHIFNGIGKTYLIGKTAPDIDDRQYFDVSTIHHGEAQPWPRYNKYNQYLLPDSDQHYLDSLETTAFLIFQNDSLLFEKYAGGYDSSTISNSFSMAKSFLAMMYGPLVDEGYLPNLDVEAHKYLPHLTGEKNATLTVRQLLQMASGIPFGESYSSPFGYMAKAYYGKDLADETKEFSVEKTPGSVWAYEGGNSVLLGMILKQATGKSPSKYFEEKIWSCIGAEHDAHWNLDDKDGLEKTFSGFYATARDFGRIGKLFLHNGVWENDTLIDPEFVRQCTTPNMIPDPKGEHCYWYGLHWWLGEHNGQEFFSCRGMRGQYIIVIPEKKLVIVRLGHLQKKERIHHMPPDLIRYIEITNNISM